ncbi:DUF393 domain-containing protein [Yoonia sp. F2084L]|uniref:thiol-disulfide oxidoreductase DCC family protein n=1 Tax=Yoonia sp. F2084L TaxID=2926419 RepID=UPI001FF31D19|nr:DCC1-like thiol-disulfide oxidoreductase family protein [Yoonia sp. F2084L]MCK0096955.1 DUF393 domain-containing protein [Yoonia sp. F2084L]
MAAKIYYDGECPFCTSYVGLVHLREAVGQVDLINLREHVAMREELTQEGYDLDQGMVVDIDGKRVGGAEATHLLATLSTSSGWFNRLNRAIFSVRWLSAFIYPFLRSGRWFTLFLMGRRTINDADGRAEERQKIFGLIFALFSVFHVIIFLLEPGRWPGGPDIIAIFIAALLLLSRPSSARLLFVLVLFSTISTVLQAPSQSNHTMLRTMMLIGYWLSFLYAMIASRPVGDIFANFTLAGRGALLVMYFFGIFHKLNTGFLDPEYSCAIALWDKMLPPISWVQSVYIDYAAIYGTFVAEGLLVLALLNPKTRHIGMIGGILFHTLLALSSYSAYIGFTTLAISLHMLFLSRQQLDNINMTKDMAWLEERAGQWTNKLALLILLVVGVFCMLLRRYDLASLCFLPAVFVVCFLIFRHGRAIDGDRTLVHSKVAYLIGAFITVLYFANGAMPYAGLKTAQAVNMFANLRIEGGVSNHIVFSEPPSLFGYLDDVASITAEGTTEVMLPNDKPEVGVVYYDLLARLADNPDLRVSFTMNGQTYEDVSSTDLQADIDARLHHPFIRKFFNFRTVKLSEPWSCR